MGVDPFIETTPAGSGGSCPPPEMEYFLLRLRVCN